MGGDVKKLRQRVASLEGELTPARVARTVRERLRRRADQAKGVDALGLVLRLLGEPALRSEEIAWAYARLKPALIAAVEQIPSLRFLDGE
jgi:hypothetical protein